MQTSVTQITGEHRQQWFHIDPMHAHGCPSVVDLHIVLQKGFMHFVALYSE